MSTAPRMRCHPLPPTCRRGHERAVYERRYQQEDGLHRVCMVCQRGRKAAARAEAQLRRAMPRPARREWISQAEMVRRIEDVRRREGVDPRLDHLIALRRIA
jgi:hypothetical protein